eukprot:11171783-Lingulodinium_polyedra.AAC.1
MAARHRKFSRYNDCLICSTTFVMAVLLSPMMGKSTDVMTYIPRSVGVQETRVALHPWHLNALHSETKSPATVEKQT